MRHAERLSSATGLAFFDRLCTRAGGLFRQGLSRRCSRKTNQGYGQSNNDGATHVGSPPNAFRRPWSDSQPSKQSLASTVGGHFGAGSNEPRVSGALPSYQLRDGAACRGKRRFVCHLQARPLPLQTKQPLS
jgi:hypothetical protein